MARKELDVVITADGRDRGKTFHIMEMSATRAEKWATRALLAIAHTGVDLGPNVMGQGMAGIAVAGIRALSSLRYEDAEPLLDELFTCVTIKPDARNPNVTRMLIEDDIEEVATRVQLKMEAINLHINFSQVAGLSTSGSAATTSESLSPNIQTSPAPSQPVFHPAKRQHMNSAQV